MKVFVTGASGFVGQAVTRELVRAGHRVVGLARSEAAAEAVTAAGGTPHPGELGELQGLRQAASAADALVHCGFVHDFARFAESCELDRAVIATLGEAVLGSQRPLLITSAIGVLPSGTQVTEHTRAPATTRNPRVATEQATAMLVERGVNAALVRLPPSVHGEGDHGFVPMLIQLAREKGESAYVGEGTNRWPAVHRDDAAVLYRLALESAVAGACWHAVAEEGVPFRELAAAIGRRLELPVVSKSTEEAAAHFTWFAHFAALDVLATSNVTREQLEWQPSRQGLLADLEQAGYFR